MVKNALKNKADYIALGAFNSAKTKKIKYKASTNLLKKVRKTTDKIVIKTNKILDFFPKYMDENMLGIIIKIKKGFTIPPVK